MTIHNSISKLSYLPLLLIAMLIPSCSSHDASNVTTLAPQSEKPSPSELRPDNSTPLPYPSRQSVHGKALPRKYPSLKAGVLGTKQVPAKDSSLSPGSHPQASRVLAFDHAPIAEVVEAVLGRELGLEYAISQEVSGDINLHIEGDYNGDELLALLAEALAVNGWDLVEQRGLYVVRPMASSDGLDVVGPANAGTGDSPQVVAYRLRYLEADQAQKAIKGFLGKDRPLAVYPGTNTIVFAERPLAARRVIQILRALDMNVFGEVGFEIVPLASVAPQEAVARLREIISGMGQLKKSPVGESTVFIPLERLPGVLVVSPYPEALHTVRGWLTALDVHTDAAGEQVMVYHLENGLATKIAPILQELFTRTAGSGSKSRLKSSQSPSTEPSSAPANKGADGAGDSGLVAELSGKALILADEENNAIVVRANATDLARIREVIQTLDIMPRAVLIKVVIAEVDLSDELQYGVEWFFRTRNSSTYAGSSLDTGTGFTREFELGDSGDGLIPSGLSLFAGSIGGWDEFAALVNLLDAKNKVHILSTPTLLAMDNTPASFTVGGREPTISRVSKDSSTDTSIVNDISYQDTGIILTVTPHINSSGLVRLEVDQRITSVNSEAIPGVDLNTPRFTERQLQTSLIAESGDTMVIGGIIQQRAVNNRSGVPILSDLPVLSFFTSTKTIENERTELLIAVTPYVVSHNSDPVSRELIQQLENMKRKLTE